MTRTAARVPPVSPFLQALATVALVVFVMYAARAVIIPIALAVLGAFILAPIVTVFEKGGLKRLPASLLTMTLAGLVFLFVGWLIVTQLTKLAQELPEHRGEIERKIDSLRGGGGPFAGFMEMVNDLTHGVRKGGRPGGPTPAGTEVAPIKVEVAEKAKSPAEKGVGDVPAAAIPQADAGSPLSGLAESAGLVVEPLATAALVFVLIVFMLNGKEDLRDRVLGVIGKGRLLGATRVLSEAAEKVSKFLLSALAVNAGFGLILTVGLYLIGVPFAPLWGFLSGLLRFIPYVGTWISAVFPVALSFATSEGWSQPIQVFVFFLILDVIAANVVEPIVFGHQTGVSPMALLISVAFFTWIWGPIGLLLSTPITVCLAVIGQHVPHLRSLALLLGDQPALPRAVQYYQRLVGNDKSGALAVAKEMVAADGLLATYDGMVVPALTLASRDRAAGELTAEEESTVFEETAEIVTATAAKPDGDDAPPPAGTGVVFGVPVHRSAEGLPLKMLAQVLHPDGYRVAEATTQMLPAQVEKMIAESGARVVVLSVLPPGGLPQTVYACKRYRKAFPELPIVVAYWGPASHYDRVLDKVRRAGATSVTTSLAQTAAQMRAALTNK
jgi:predicted PurR-regulated permease PerM